MQANEILILNGNRHEEMAYELMKAAGLADDIGDKAARIVLKPNLVIADTADYGAVTHPALVSGVIRYLKENGFSHIRVMEGSWVGAGTSEAYAVSGLQNVCEQWGVPFTDLQKSPGVAMNAAGLSMKVCAELKEIDYLINMPVLKGHCQTMMTCALKNCKGLLTNSEKRHFHAMGLHKPIAHLSTLIPRQMILVDNICGDVDFEEGGNPVYMGRIFCCKDPVLCDAFGCSVLGLELDEVPYIRMAEALGSGCSDLKNARITSLNDALVLPKKGSTGRIRQLEKYVDASEACSACYGMLIHALDKMEKSGKLRNKKERICIGQGYKASADSKSGETAGKAGIGIGRCTASACPLHLNGCPPTAEAILSFLEGNWV